MLSISFLPWVLLLAFTLLSVPIVAVVESQRRKKALGPAPAEDANEQDEAEMPEMVEDLDAGSENVEEVAFAEASDDDDLFS